MTTKHTPGPWNAEPMIRDHGFPCTPVMATTLIARVYSTAFGDDEQSLANAALIAAAPRMLEALKKEQEWRDREAAGELDDGWDYETMVGQYRRAAIAQAEGHQ